MKKILLCTDGSAYSQVASEYAAWSAQRAEVRVEILYVSDLRGQEVAQTTDFSGSIGMDSYQQLLNQLVEVEAAKATINHEQAKIILQAAKQIFSDRQISVNLSHLDN